MKKLVSILLAVLLLLSTSAFAETADTVIYGSIYTSDDTQPWAEAAAVKDGVFVYVGDAASAYGSGTSGCADSPQ